MSILIGQKPIIVYYTGKVIVRNRMLSQHNIRLSTKLRIYNAVALPSLLYGCESWTLYRRHITFVCKPSLPSLESACRTASQTLKSWTVLTPQVSSPCSSRHNSAGWDMSSGWKSTACQDACCTESSYKAKDTKAARRNGTRTRSKPAFSGVNLNQRSWKRPPVKDHRGAAELTKLLKTLRTLDDKSSLLPEISAMEHLQQPSQPRTSSAPTVPDSAPPDWACRATSECTVETQNG